MLSYALALYGAQKRHLGEPGPDGPPFPLVQQEGEARSSAPALSVCRKGPGPASAARRRANYRAATATPIPCIAASRFSGWLRVPTRWRASSAASCLGGPGPVTHPPLPESRLRTSFARSSSTAAPPPPPGPLGNRQESRGGRGRRGEHADTELGRRRRRRWEAAAARARRRRRSAPKSGAAARLPTCSCPAGRASSWYWTGRGERVAFPTNGEWRGTQLASRVAGQAEP